jgi:hypothetical protein
VTLFVAFLIVILAAFPRFVGIGDVEPQPTEGEKMFGRIAFMALIVALPVSVLVQGGPPGGGDTKIQLSDLGCGPDVIDRVNDADEWDLFRAHLASLDWNSQLRVGLQLHCGVM